jgi:hypothetical protein
MQAMLPHALTHALASLLPASQPSHNSAKYPCAPAINQTKPKQKPQTVSRAHKEQPLTTCCTQAQTAQSSSVCQLLHPCLPATQKAHTTLSSNAHPAPAPLLPKPPHRISTSTPRMSLPANTFLPHQRSIPTTSHPQKCPQAWCSA